MYRAFWLFLVTLKLVIALLGLLVAVLAICLIKEKMKRNSNMSKYWILGSTAFYCML